MNNTISATKLPRLVKPQVAANSVLNKGSEKIVATKSTIKSKANMKNQSMKRNKTHRSGRDCRNQNNVGRHLCQQNGSLPAVTATIDPEQLDREFDYLTKVQSRLKDLVLLQYIAECLYGTFRFVGGENRAKRAYEALTIACEAMDDYCNGHSKQHKEEWLADTCLGEAIENWEEENKGGPAQLPC
jgi:hypothetical protein